MEKFIEKLRAAGFSGETDDSAKARDLYSHDASLFEVRPEIIVYPKSSADVQALIRTVSKEKANNPDLSVTARSGGTDMSGGAINDSVIADFTRYFNKIHSVNFSTARVQPGVYYRDFEVQTLKHGALLPPYPASRDLCTIGGMVNNNSGGEKSLQYGKTEKFVTELKVVFADGNEYTVKPLSKKELDAKIKLRNFEGDIYRRSYQLIEKNYERIKAAKPKVSKDSTGYHLWNVWDRETGIFDLTQGIVGAQGTLGLTTEAKFRLVPASKHSGTLVIFLRKINDLGKIINQVMKHNPATFEGFDNYTLMLSFKLFFYFHKTLGWWNTIKLGLQLLPNALMLFRGIPKMVLLVEFNGATPEEVAKKVHDMRIDLNPYNQQALFEEDETELKSRKFWIMRRQSFQLLRQKVKDKHTAPYIDDLVVNPEHLPKFLPELRKIINKYKLLATIAGHMGDGNFHIIPLMKLEEKKERAKLEPSMKEVNKLVLKYGGSLSGEHNDGMVRGPWLEEMYGKEMLEILRDFKHIFDPENIFNPHKKVTATWDYSFSHVRDHF
ncbi:FAD-binding oxidoreductase [Candidatus Saccharibacteria bacterium]|nr:FAD-binding oxidoreductase [Candidatus Saccharibacteria bacterium]